MVNILVVDKGCQINMANLKNLDKLHVKCKYRSKKNFEKRHTWKVGDIWVSVFAKDCGKAGNENKYDLPPPLDNSLFFGSLCIFKMNDDKYGNLTKQEWEKIYEQLFGGFEDLDNSDEDERSADSEVFSDDNYTKEGYLKDEFVVEDDELKEEEYLSEDD